MNELENQLHEQYATNANNNVGTIVTLATSTLAVLAAYGYCFIHCGNLKSLLLCENGAAPNEIYTANTLLLAAMAAMFVLAVLYCVSVYLGSYQRLEQFITYTIRWERYSNEKDSVKDRMSKIFPKGYDPFNKNICNFVQGLHGFSLHVYCYLFIIILIATSWATCCCPCLCQCCEKSSTCASCLFQILFLVEVVTLILVCYGYKRIRFAKYKKREKEYKEKLKL